MMTTKKRVYKIIAEQLGTDSPLSDDLDLQKDLNAGLEDIEELFLSLEEELKLELTKEDKATVVTVGNILNLVKDYLNELEE